jgi:hypothetical protein
MSRSASLAQLEYGFCGSGDLAHAKRHTDPNFGTRMWPLNLLLDRWELVTDFVLHGKFSFSRVPAFYTY